MLLSLKSENALCKILEAMIQIHTTYTCNIYFEIILILQLCEIKNSEGSIPIYLNLIKKNNFQKIDKMGVKPLPAESQIEQYRRSKWIGNAFVERWRK